MFEKFRTSSLTVAIQSLTWILIISRNTVLFMTRYTDRQQSELDRDLYRYVNLETRAIETARGVSKNLGKISREINLNKSVTI